MQGTTPHPRAENPGPQSLGGRAGFPKHLPGGRGVAWSAGGSGRGHSQARAAPQGHRRTGLGTRALGLRGDIQVVTAPPTVCPIPSRPPLRCPGTGLAGALEGTLWCGPEGGPGGLCLRRDRLSTLLWPPRGDTPAELGPDNRLQKLGRLGGRRGRRGVEEGESREGGWGGGRPPGPRTPCA